MTVSIKYKNKMVSSGSAGIFLCEEVYVEFTIFSFVKRKIDYNLLVSIV